MTSPLDYPSIAQVHFNLVAKDYNPQEGKAMFTYIAQENSSVKSPSAMAFIASATAHGVEACAYLNNGEWLEISAIGDIEDIENFNRNYQLAVQLEQERKSGKIPDNGMH